MRTLERDSFGRLLETLERRGYRVVGPTVRDGAIAYEPIGKVDELPIGVTEEQEPAPTVTLVPTVTPSSAGLTGTLRF